MLVVPAVQQAQLVDLAQPVPQVSQVQQPTQAQLAQQDLVPQGSQVQQVLRVLLDPVVGPQAQLVPQVLLAKLVQEPLDPQVPRA